MWERAGEEKTLWITSSCVFVLWALLMSQEPGLGSPHGMPQNWKLWGSEDVSHWDNGRGLEDEQRLKKILHCPPGTSVREDGSCEPVW